MYVMQKLSQTALVALLCLRALLSTANAGTPPQSTPWAVLRCTASDVPQPIAIPSNYATTPDGFFSDFFTSSGAGKGGIYDYWRQVSHGQTSLDGTEVFPWVTLSAPSAVVSTLSFKDAAQPCLDAALAQKAGNLSKGVGYLSKFYGLFVIINEVIGGEQGDNSVSLTANGKPWRTLPLVVFSLNVLSVNNAAHEMGHGYGLQHANDLQKRNCGSLEGPDGVYCDFWDPMGSPLNGGTTFVNPTFNHVIPFQNMGDSPPGLNAVHLSYLGWISPTQTFVYDYSQPDEVSVTLAALGFPHSLPSPRLGSLGAILPLQIGVPLGSEYTVEFRRHAAWDRGFIDSVIIHWGWSPDGAAMTEVVDQPFALLTAGQSFTDSDGEVTILVKSINAFDNTATIVLSRPGLCDGILQRLYSTIREGKLLALMVPGWEQQLVSCRNQNSITEAEYNAAVAAISPAHL
jgi:hypothetical protein